VQSFLGGNVEQDKLLQKLGAYDFTPVDEREGMLFKRDDLFVPFGAGSVNGGKLRQGSFLLAKAAQQGYQRVLTGCSLVSPQAPMIAAVAEHFGMGCVVLYGGTRMELLEKRHMPRLAMHYGADIKIAKSGRANVLLHEAGKISAQSIPSHKDFIVLYGMNSKDPEHLVAFYESTANQVRNLPDSLDHLAITCGSGITAAGVLYGLQKYHKNVQEVWLLGTAPNRERKVRTRLFDLELHTKVPCRNAKFHYIDLYAEGMTYDKEIKGVHCEDIDFHKHYEAKTYPWVRENLKGKICFWIIGAMPTLLA
jgi:1-aminocyclopropane-1-carboxylate deaminase/D-cysteine desulfhydrase-like pyridoxal-dependent ACC family enzyme